MELGRHIREYRQRDGLSQEALAKRFYVTRQTISNWETERSYPDIQSLLLLSVLFDVSLDELVKGDIEVMREEVNASKLSVWFWVSVVCLVLGLAVAEPLRLAFGFGGLVVPGVLIAAAIVAGVVFEVRKKKQNLETYTEVLALVEGKPADERRVSWEKRHQAIIMAVALVVGGLAGILLSHLSDLIAAGFVG